MSEYREEKITPLLSFPYDTFLMLRCEFVQIVGNDLEARVLRIIEKTVQAERKRLARERLTRGGGKVGADPLAIPRDIWVPISYPQTGAQGPAGQAPDFPPLPAPCPLRCPAVPTACLGAATAA